jgi:hypothetical protein
VPSKSGPLLCGVLMLITACAGPMYAPHRSSTGLRVIYPPSFPCSQIVSDFGSFQGTLPSLTRPRPHDGIDIFGDKIIAAAAGTVIRINTHGAGHQVGIRHRPEDLGLEDIFGITWYVHMREESGRHSALNYIREGQPVDRGHADHVNPHDWWADHPLDEPGKVKYIPHFQAGKRYSKGLTYPIACE